MYADRIEDASVAVEKRRIMTWQKGQLIIGVGVKFTFLLHGLERKAKGIIVASLQILAVATVILELH